MRAGAWIVIAAFPALLSSGCTNSSVSGNRAETENQAIAVANEYLSNRPLTDEMTIEAVDMGNRWRLSYDHPDGGTGGPIIVVVNKRTGEVVHAETEQ
jgi:hypothetical protein